MEEEAILVTIITGGYKLFQVLVVLSLCGLSQWEKGYVDESYYKF